MVFELQYKDIWQYLAEYCEVEGWQEGMPPFQNAIFCVTTNAIINSKGNAVMGAGIAKEVRDRFPGIDRVLAGNLLVHGNVLNNLTIVQYKGLMLDLMSFPVKNHWKWPADIKLIRQSCQQLAEYLRAREYQTVLPLVFLPRPGTGNGKLDWETHVKPIVYQELNDVAHHICVFHKEN